MQKQFSGGVLLAAAGAGIGAAASGAQPGLCASSQTWRAQLATDPTGAVGLAASTLLWLLIGLVAVGVVATVLGRLPGALGRFCDAVSRRLLPAVMRRSLHLMIGVTVGVTALAPSGAWAATVGFTRPGIAVTQSAPADSLPNPLPALGEPGGPVTMPTDTTPLPQVAPAPDTPTGTPGTPAPTAVAPSRTPAPSNDAPSPAPSAAAPSPSAPGASTRSAAAPSLPTQDAPSTSNPLPSTQTGTSSPPAVPAGVRPPVGGTAVSPRPPVASRPAKAPVRQTLSPPRGAKTPTWPGVDATLAGALGDTTGSAATSAVSVTPGDSLWVLAARDLARRDGGATPSDAAIAAEWPRWWAANRLAIGADPDLLTPGQRLTPPA